MNLSPAEKAKHHLKLSEKYLAEAEELLKRGDYIMASEKGVGCCSRDR